MRYIFLKKETVYVHMKAGQKRPGILVYYFKKRLTEMFFHASQTILLNSLSIRY